MDQQFQEFINGINRVLMERHGAKMILLIQAPIGMDVITNMIDPVERLGFLRGATISTEELFKSMLTNCADTGDAESHLKNVAEIITGKPPGGKAN